ncbi:MAG: preprotein translocase subunit SecE [Clostridia bacterium]|nr:preprotein translocase subunit SecE [Clostridia bacterium]
MADKNIDKEALKAQKEAEKAAEKAKKERIKQSKPKKEGTVFSRGGAAVKKFCKDFVGTCKKVVWPTGRQVLKNAGVVLATILVIGIAVFAVDWCLTEVFDLAKQGAVSLGEQFADETTTAAEGTTAAADETTTAEGETSEETTVEEDTTAEETTATEEETTAA